MAALRLVRATSLLTERLGQPKKIVGLVAVKEMGQAVVELQVLVAIEYSMGPAKAVLFRMTAIAAKTDINSAFQNYNKYLTITLGDCAPVREGDKISIDAMITSHA